MQKTKLFALMAAICISWQLQAQSVFKPGYIITPEQDTVFGLIEPQSQMRSQLFCNFKPDEKSEIRVYTAEDLGGYGFADDRHFDSKPAFGEDEGKGKMQFYELLFDGIIRLYTLRKDQSAQLFIEVDNQIHLLENTRSQVYTGTKTVEKENKEYVGKLLFLLQDAPHLRDRIGKLKLEPIPMIKLFKHYHTHITGNKDYVQYYGERGFSASYTLLGQFKFNRITHTTYHDVITIPSNHPAIGLRTDVRIPNRRVQAYAQFTYEAYNSYLENGRYIFFDFSLLSLQAGISYPLEDFLYPSFVYAGLKGAYVYKPQLYEFTYVPHLHNPLFIDDFAHPNTDDKVGLGLTGGFRHIKKISPKWGISAGAELEFLMVNMAGKNRFLYVGGLHLGIVFN